MSGETDLSKLLKTLKPRHNPGDYVFCLAEDWSVLRPGEIVMFFKEEEGNTVILLKERADELGLEYSFVASWITLTVHSSLEAVGLTAAFATALAGEGISCNVVAAYYHDHIFVDKKETEKAMEILGRFGG
jgi:uncharacterized protein